MSTYRSEWHLTEIKAPLEYPPEAYVFTKSLEVLEKTETYYGTFAKKIQYSISGNVSPFAVTIVGYNLAGTVFAIWRMQGPVSGILDLSFAYDGWGLPGVGFYAHPNPAEVWNQYTYRFYNWK